MDVQITAERQAQLEEYAQRRGQDLSEALDEILAEAMEMEQQDYQDSVEAIRRGYADFKAGRTRSVAESFAELREKYGLPS